VVWVRERTIPTEGPPLIGEVSANFLRIEENCGIFSEKWTEKISKNSSSSDICQEGLNKTTKNISQYN
jgi:hypothetical protein